ncbi:MAG: hypothetical protein IPJ26_16410 [Bacteroidetes bacterium]|nr:hypothetical protein [Bacteroidota bacterium]
MKEGEENNYSLVRKLLSSSGYTISTRNEFIQSKDSVAYVINVIPDQYPQIEVEEQRFQLLPKNLFQRDGDGRLRFK